MAFLSKIAEGDLIMNIHLEKLFRAMEPEQQNNTVWFLTFEIPGKSWGSHPNTDTERRRILGNDEKKLNPQDKTESRMRSP